MKENEKETEIFKDLIKEGAKNLELLPDMNLEDVLKNQKFHDSFNNLVANIIPNILLMSIDANSYDNSMQIVLRDNTIRFFTNLENLVQQAKIMDDNQTKSLISAFLQVPAIRHLKVPEGRRLTASVLAEGEIIDGFNKFQNSEKKVQEVFDYLGTLLSSVEEKSKKLLKIPRRFEKEVENYVNLIKNHYETARYTLGLLLGLFDILDETLMKQESWYFSEKRTASFFYFGPKNYRGQRFWLRDYLLIPKYEKDYASIRDIFDKWFFVYVKGVRIHSAHEQINIQQNQSHDGKYLIEINGMIEGFSLDNIRELEKNSFRFNLMMKHLIARKFYSDDKELVNYLLEGYP